MEGEWNDVEDVGVKERRYLSSPVLLRDGRLGGMPARSRSCKEIELLGNWSSVIGWEELRRS